MAIGSIMENRGLRVDLTGKTAFVTGGAKGIGRAISKALAENGADLVINYLSSGQLAEGLAMEIVQRGGKAAVFQGDVSSADDVERLFAKAEEFLGGPVDILVNNAGTPHALSPVETMPLELWEKVISVNLTSAMLCARRAIAGMKRKGWGRIVNISSISARSGGGPGGAAYASAKAGMSALTKALARELGSAGITCNAVAPGVIMTDLHEKLSTKESLEQARKATLLGRLGEPDDVAGAVLYLVSDSASYVTGETIAVNGGLRMD